MKQQNLESGELEQMSLLKLLRLTEQDKAEPGWQVTDNWEWNGYTTECHDQVPRPDRNHYRRHLARQEPACPISSINHGLFQRLRTKGHLEQYQPQGKTYLCELHSPFQPNFGHHLRHQARNEDACLQSLRETRAATYLKNHDSLEGWVDKIGGETTLSLHNCDIHDPVKPGHSHASAHYALGEGACDQAKREKSAAYYLDKHGTLDGWEWKPQSDGSQHNCELHTPFTPNGAHRSYHRNKGEDVCDQATRERSAYNHIERVGSLEGWVDKWIGEIYFPYSCETSKDEDIVPTASHYSLHSRREENHCEESKRQLSAHKYLKRYESLEGWRYIPQNPEGHNCEPHEPTRPNKAHYAYHKGRDEEPCPQSKKEQSAYEYNRQHGSLDGWNYNPVSGYVSDCDTTGEIVPSKVHYQRHFQEGSEYCDRALLEASAYGHKIRHGNIDDWTPNLYRRGRYSLHRIYKITFENHDVYYGITNQLLEIRIYGHIDVGLETGQRLTAGEPHTIEVLCEAENKREAEQIEKLMIKSGNPKGRLLNDRENPWYNLPAPHWGNVIDRQTKRTKKGKKRVIETRYDNLYICGTRQDAQQPRGSHLNYHLLYGETPCPTSRQEAAWERAERDAGHPIPNYLELQKQGTATFRKIEAELADPDRASCCGAPLKEVEVNNKYRSRHISEYFRRTHNTPIEQCEAAKVCARAYDRHRNPSKRWNKMKAEQAEPARMKCCGAPTTETEPTPKYDNRHRRQTLGISAEVCEPAKRCEKAYKASLKQKRLVS